MTEASVLPSSEHLLAKRVQDMFLAGEEPVGAYICRDVKEEAENVPSESSPIPVIHLDLVSSSASHELHKLKSALTSWGCFQAIGHGIPTKVLDEIRRVTKEFFELPMEEKSKYARRRRGDDDEVLETVEGYGSDPAPENNTPLNWQDRLFLNTSPQDIRNYRFWPHKPKQFREALDEYIKRITMMFQVISTAMAESLNLEENCFQNQLGERASLQARFNYYSPCSTPDVVLGLRPHQDGSAYTIILQDEVEGLQVFNHHKWFTIPTMHAADALLIIMGDQMEIMTNGIFKSPMHRVITNSEKARISVAVFNYPDKKNEIGPEDGLITHETPRLFNNIKDYGNQHWKHYQRGEGALHVARS